MKKVIELTSYFVCAQSVQTMTRERLIHLLFLSDWKSVLIRGNTIIDVRWVHVPSGPFCEELAEFLSTHPAFRRVFSNAHKAGWHESFALTLSSWGGLSNSDLLAAEHVLDATSAMASHELRRLVQSTFPIMTTPMNTRIDLCQSAIHYGRQQRNQDWRSPSKSDDADTVPFLLPSPAQVKSLDDYIRLNR